MQGSNVCAFALREIGEFGGSTPPPVPIAAARMDQTPAGHATERTDARPRHRFTRCRCFSGVLPPAHVVIQVSCQRGWRLVRFVIRAIVRRFGVIIIPNSLGVWQRLPGSGLEHGLLSADSLLRRGPLTLLKPAAGAGRYICAVLFWLPQRTRRLRHRYENTPTARSHCGFVVFRQRKSKEFQLKPRIILPVAGTSIFYFVL